mmetsp:Transcript_28449/g.78373  ORF Transcript_28449/g.78373 Transcript_28449/m.78373 type:complete len:121 (-) Transcript_28449:101-463(-)|eukprot:CAMPEP_0117504820 /NCGR_PEP_ID=MMETSP0784-20121206/25048_1 /TAXON_ID=39447 /ORGANISM="" /LENGTH=120 /DNA_ID=CAMNT_0005300191 /DNA_START=76 /DNA_END=438 /DNA_ORIENTATION=-
MSLLRSARQLAHSANTASARAFSAPSLSLRRTPIAPLPFGQRGLALARSTPRFGHNLEDHFDMAEFVCKMHSPTGEYLIWGLMFSTFFVTFGPLLHSNYYFTGRFLPKDQGNTQLCDDSW